MPRWQVFRSVVASPWAALLPLVLTALVLGQWVFASFEFHATYTATDDTFYYYSWARHLAAGDGPTADGTVATNGVQPLWALLLAGLAACVKERDAFVTAALLLGLVLARFLVEYQWATLTGMEISLDLALGSVLVYALVRLAALRRAEQNLPADAVLGSFNSGLLHYVASRPVRNLDGRVDDGAFARHLARGGDALSYVGGRGVTHVTDRIYLDQSVFGRFWSDVTATGEIVARFPASGAPGTDVVVLKLPVPEPRAP